jgi:glucose uptake protein
MILPTTYGVALLLTIFTMICWGSWANTFKLAGKWRFELFYYDYAVGVLIMATLAALTFGSMGDSSLTFIDNMIVAGNRKIAFGIAAGVVFNLANMLLVAAIAVAGMAVAFPVGIGLALVVGVIWSYILNPQGNPVLLGAGVVVVLAAIVVDAIAYQRHTAHMSALAAEAAAAAPGMGSEKKVKRTTGTKTKKKMKTGAKGIVLSLISGVLMGSFYPLVEIAKEGGDIGFGLLPYAIAFVFAIGVFISTFVFNLYFLNLPILGKSIPMTAYFTGTLKQHLLGIAGGLIWCAGAIANFAAASSPKEVQVGPAVSYAIGQGATMVSALWGLIVWKEFAGATKNVRVLLAVMLILFVIGLALISLAPLYSRAA